jgi:hypothetical protein
MTTSFGKRSSGDYTAYIRSSFKPECTLLQCEDKSSTSLVNRTVVSGLSIAKFPLADLPIAFYFEWVLYLIKQ